jgi:hypothetical protein
MSFEERWMDVDASRVPDPPWPHVWALTARALVTGGRLQDVETHLWRWRWSGWIVALDGDATTCPVCGARIVDEGVRVHGRRSSCTNACRQLRARLRAKSLSTPWEARVAEARLLRAQLEAAATGATRWLMRHRLLHPGSVILPPNWSSMRHAPVLPARCDRACDSVKICGHTGGPCLFAAIGRTE